VAEVAILFVVAPLRLLLRQARPVADHALDQVVRHAQALEALAFDGGFGVLVGLLELVFAGSILAAGAGGGLHVVLLAVWTILTLALAWRYLKRLRAWTLERLRMTHDLVERMVGHRTRLAQEQPQRRDHEEDRELGSYVHTSTAMDRAILPIIGVMPRGWMFVALAGIAPAFVSGRAQPADVAIALGGMLLAGRALTSVSNGVAAVGRASVAWSQVAAFFRAGEKEAVARQPFLPSAAAEHAQAGWRRPVSSAASVDLPPPELPSSRMRSPRAIDRSTPASTGRPLAV
jgi:ATP-binding cassette subfamily B protein